MLVLEGLIGLHRTENRNYLHINQFPKCQIFFSLQNIKIKVKKFLIFYQTLSLIKIGHTILELGVS